MQVAKVMLEVIRSRLRGLTGFLTRHCQLGKYMARIGLKNNSHWRFCAVEDESIEIKLHVLQFIKDVRLDGEL